VTFRGVLLFVAVLCSALPSTALPAASVAAAPNARQATPHRTASPFGIPFPDSRDPQAWQAWRERVRAELEARHSPRPRANNGGATAGGVIETIAGAAPFQKPVNALKTGFGQIQGIAEDSSGNLYVASCDLGVVLKVDSSSNTTVYAGQPLPTGPAISSGDGGPATSARFPCPAGLAVDNANNLYVTDIVAGTIRKIGAATGTIRTIAGIPGQLGHTGDGGPATSALLEYPSGLAFDGAGNLYIGDLEYVRKMNLASGVIQTVAGIGNQVPQCWLTASSTCPASQVGLTLLGQSIAFANGRLYAAASLLSVGSAQLCGGAVGGIVSIDPVTGVMQLLVGGGYCAGTSAAYPGIGLQLNSSNIAADAGGNLYFTGPNQLPGSGPLPNDSPVVESVEELQSADHTIRVLAGVASERVYAGDGGPASEAMLRAPTTICLSPSGEVVFVDNFNIRSFPPGGNIETMAGNGLPNFSGDDGLALQAGLDYPSDVASDAQGNLYVADWWNGRVRRIDAATGVITTVAGGGVLWDSAADGGPALQAGLNPIGIVLDSSSDHLYLHDYGYGLRVVDLTTGTIKTLTVFVSDAAPLVFDGDKTLYYGTGGNTGPYSEVQAVDVTTGSVTTIAGGSGNLLSGDGGPATLASLYDVQGLALDDQGNLYIADSGFENIRKVKLSTGIISTLAGVHPSFTYPTGYSGDGGPAVAATFDSPAGLAYDGAGHLTVADSRNHVLRQIDLTTNIITTIAGNHTPGFGGDGASPSAAMLYDPRSATYDPAGNLIIADTYNDRIRRVVLHPTKLNATLTYGGASSGGITFTATYSGLSFGIAPTGTVTFLNGSTSLGTGTLAAATDGSGGYVAAVTLTSAPVNGTNITAQYSGDLNYASVTTTATFEPVTPSYTVSAKPASLTIKQGFSGSIVFTVTPQNGFNQAVSFHCDSATLPMGASCSFSPASVTPDGGSAVTTTLTVQTTGASITALDRRTTPISGWLPPGGAVLALMLLGMPRVRRRRWLGGSALMLFALCLTGIFGCGGDSKSGGGGTQNANATPAGTYSIQVTTSVGTSSGLPPLTVSLTVTQ
jgi:sugar lactone lactonase YvrE